MIEKADEGEVCGRGKGASPHGYAGQVSYVGQPIMRQTM